MGTTTKDGLMAKAEGFMEAIKKMPEKERLNDPSREYGEDYNKLRQLTADKYPDLEELLPPEVTTKRVGMAEKIVTQQSFGEIDTYCAQIEGLLRTL